MKKGKTTLVTGTIGIAAAGFAAGSKLKKEFDSRRELTQKLGSYYHILNRWLMIHQNGGSLVSYFVDNNYKAIAIYGYKELGERLYDELKDSDIEVKYIIDRTADNIYAEVDAYTPNDALMEVDAVIVTASYYFEEIKKILGDKLDCPIVSIGDVVSNML